VWCIDISADSTLLAGASFGSTARIWSLDTSELVAGPFEFSDDISGVQALRFSANSRKLAVLSNQAQCLQVWDVQAQNLKVTRSRGKSTLERCWVSLPVFWTKKDQSIIAAFSFTDDPASTIHEFDASTLETVGDSFQGHTKKITGLALSFDCALLASASLDGTIKLWSFESRQLLASFNVQNPFALILSPDSRKLAYAPWGVPKIRVCKIPANVIARISHAKEIKKPGRSRLTRLLNSNTIRRTMRRKSVTVPVKSPISRPQIPLPIARDPHAFLRFLRKLVSSSHTNVVHPIHTDEPRNRLDFPATVPLPHSHINPHKNSRSPPAPPTTKSWWPIWKGQTLPAIINVPLAQGKEWNAAADVPSKDDKWIRDEDYVSPPPSLNLDSRQPPTGGQINSGEHGSGRLCFCF
ncbi:hypothetical protein DEU56DRAFT_283933, partial [Suillus clintonianus]|uniref:uncharacterized protein n=1 Tax=Suillus clintonianus TaxID=1904413 RepID=UPI001B886E87